MRSPTTVRVISGGGADFGVVGAGCGELDVVDRGAGSADGVGVQAQRTTVATTSDHLMASP
jgi:xanthine/CO dehydrogenase XdhC/CoxF family maturation factor